MPTGGRKPHPGALGAPFMVACVADMLTAERRASAGILSGPWLPNMRRCTDLRADH